MAMPMLYLNLSEPPAFRALLALCIAATHLNVFEKKTTPLHGGPTAGVRRSREAKRNASRLHVVLGRRTKPRR